MDNVIIKKITEGIELLTGSLLSFAVIALVFILFSLLVKKKCCWSSFLAARQETSFNLVVMVLNFLLIPFWYYVVAGMIRTYVLLPEFTLPPQIWHQLPMWLAIPLTLFIGDFIAYWRHRFEHSRLLWPSHAMHHSDTQMSWLTLNRFHPVNRVTTFFVDIGMLSLLGVPPFFIAINSAVRHYYGYFVHADLPWTYGIFGRVFVSPVMHKWHHALDRRAFNANFATIFSVFDQLFGTYYVPGQCNTPLGALRVSGKPVWYQLTYPLRPSAYKRSSPPTESTIKPARVPVAK